MDDQLPSFLRSFLELLEEDELLDDEEDDLLFLDLPLCFLTFLHHLCSTFFS